MMPILTSKFMILRILTRMCEYVNPSWARLVKDLRVFQSQLVWAVAR
ncbi:hypothetical protein ACHAXN_001246 [Cyclotella atomus]